MINSIPSELQLASIASARRQLRTAADAANLAAIAGDLRTARHTEMLREALIGNCMNKQRGWSIESSLVLSD